MTYMLGLKMAKKVGKKFISMIVTQKVFLFMNFLEPYVYRIFRK